MSIITPYLNQLTKVENSMELVARMAVQENMEFILFQLKERQLGLGLDSKGSEVGKYSSYTQLMASDPQNRPRKEKQAGSPYNFDWTGEFVESLIIKQEQDSYSIFSTTGKDKFLEGIYKTQLTKFTPENNEIVNNTIILPYLYKYILENMFKV